MHGEVVEVVRLTPSMVRVVLGGHGLDGYQPTDFTDQYVNALFAPPGAPEGRTVGRRYTIRRWDPDRRQVWIDFVLHGDVGHAGRWANHAQPGDVLAFVGPSGAYRPSTACDWHLMVGDESALPAIAASLEAVRPEVPVIVVAVVDGPEHELVLDTPGAADVRWIHRCTDPGNPDLLPEAVRALDFPEGVADVFVHGEAAEVRAVRRHLVADRGIPKEGASISPYWRRGLDDEGWREIKSAWLKEQQRDV
ncbi:MAG: siderophore-interacting protein [Ilumatobacteraceae bacterium]